MHTLPGRTAFPFPACRKIFRKPFLSGYKKAIRNCFEIPQKVFSSLDVLNKMFLFLCDSTVP